MGIFRRVGKVFKPLKPLVNFPRWMGWTTVSTTAKDIGKTAKDLFVVQQAARQETFEDAVKRLRLTEATLQQRMKSLLRMAIIYCLIAVVLAAYCLYLFLNGHFPAALLSFALTVLALTFAFREHFWYFQMKQRRLGCTFKQWLSAIFRRV